MIHTEEKLQGTLSNLQDEVKIEPILIEDNWEQGQKPQYRSWQYGLKNKVNCSRWSLKNTYYYNFEITKETMKTIDDYLEAAELYKKHKQLGLVQH